MSGERILVLSGDPGVYLEAIRARLPVTVLESCSDVEELEALLERLRPTIVLASRIGSPFPRQALFDCGSIRWIQTASAGVDHLLPLETKAVVTSASGIHDEVIADYVVGSVLSWNLHFPLFYRQQRERSWKSRELWPSSESALAVLGLGSIGSLAARKAKALGMRVLGIKARPRNAPPEVDEVLGPEGLLDAVGRSDFLAVTLPLTPSTRGLVSETVLRAMKKDSVLINVSRGGIVDENALLKVLSEGPLRGATMDVFVQEPLPRDGPLWDQPNLVITPHTGDIRGWRQRVAELFLSNFEKWRAGVPLANVVDPERGY